MRVKREAIVNGILSYIEDEVIPKIDDKATQIIASVGTGYARGNPKFVDNIFSEGAIKALLDDDGSGTYEISGLFGAMEDSIRKYGGFPVQIPPIPLISPSEKSLKFTEDDIAEIRRRIERGS